MKISVTVEDIKAGKPAQGQKETTKMKFKKVNELPAGAKKLSRKELAYGEVTGHSHKVDVGDLFETKNGELFLKVENLSKLSHEEHKTIVLNPGVYQVFVKRQYTPEGWEAVRD